MAAGVERHGAFHGVLLWNLAQQQPAASRDDGMHLQEPPGGKNEGQFVFCVVVKQIAFHSDAELRTTPVRLDIFTFSPRLPQLQRQSYVPD
jgi:hypothetical protein